MPNVTRSLPAISSDVKTGYRLPTWLQAFAFPKRERLKTKAALFNASLPFDFDRRLEIHRCDALHFHAHTLHPKADGELLSRQVIKFANRFRQHRALFVYFCYPSSFVRQLYCGSEPSLSLSPSSSLYLWFDLIQAAASNCLLLARISPTSLTLTFFKLEPSHPGLISLLLFATFSSAYPRVLLLFLPLRLVLSL